MKIVIRLQAKVFYVVHELDDLKIKKGFLTLLFPLTIAGIMSDNLVPVDLLAHLGVGCSKYAVVVWRMTPFPVNDRSRLSSKTHELD